MERGTIVTESLDASPFVFHFGVSLPSVPNWLPVLPLAGFEVLVVAPVVPGCFGGSGGKGRLPIPTGGSALLALVFQVMGVAPQGIGFELLECCRAFQ